MPYPWRSALFRGTFWGLILLAHLALVTYFYPVFLEQQGSLLKFARQMGGVFNSLADVSTKSDWAFFSSQQLSKLGNVLGVAMATLFAVGAVAGEAHRGSLEILLARPRSRTRILLERYAAGGLALMVPLWVTTPMVMPLAEQMGTVALMQEKFNSSFQLPTELLVRGAIHEGFFLLSIYSVTFLLSCLASRVEWIVIGVLGASLVLGAIYLVPVTTDYSPFRFADPMVYLEFESQPGLPWKITGSLIGVSLGCLALSWLVFMRRLPNH